MRALVVVTISVVAMVAASARPHETKITGIVVDSRGRPVAQAVISAGFREPHFSAPGIERVVIMLDIQAGNDGRFSFTTSEQISDLMIHADSPDLKRSGQLKHIAKTGNIVVVR